MLHTQPLFELQIDVDPPLVIGDVCGELRRAIPLRGGSVAGLFAGRVLPGGMDFQTVRADGVIEIAAQYVLARGDGARVEVRSHGVRAARPEVLAALAAGEVVPASEYYFRTHMRFVAAAPDLVRLNQVLAVSVGERRPDSVALAVYEVL
jgi:Protein of unknown function (DUF3237)